MKTIDVGRRVQNTNAPELSFLYEVAPAEGVYKLGDRCVVPDGRSFRYCKAGATMDPPTRRGLINGHIIPGDSGSGYEGSLQAVAVAGAFKVRITDVNTAANRPKDYYRAGQFVLFYGTSGSPIFVANITASTAGNETYVELTLDAKLPVLTTTSMGITAYPSIYSSIKPGMAQLQDFESFVVVPVPVTKITSAYYFWGQTWGPTWVTAHGGTWPGVSACLRDVYFHIDGTIDPATIRVVGTLSPQRAGYLLHAGSSGSYGDGLIMLQLDR